MKKLNLSFLLGLAALALVGCSDADNDECDADAAKKVDVGPSNLAEDFRMNIKDRVFFKFDSAEISTDAADRLKEQAAWLATNSATKAAIEGHCDARGTREYNLALGERRANAAKDTLVAAGVSPDRLSVISYGKDKLPVEGTTEEAHAQNRVAITVVN